KGFKELIRSLLIKVAEKDIKVWKILHIGGYNGEKTYYTPYMNTVIRPRQVATVKEFGIFTNSFSLVGPMGFITIEEGLHSYKTKKWAEMQMTSSKRIIVPCIIPKGTQYIEGDNDIVSLKLVYPSKFE